jgi:hypothetical protein
VECSNLPTFFMKKKIRFLSADDVENFIVDFGTSSDLTITIASVDL